MWLLCCDCDIVCLVMEDPGAPKPVGPIMTPAIGPALEVSCLKTTITLYPIGRPVRATITLYPIGRPVRATITLYPIGRPVRATITLYPIGRPVRAKKINIVLFSLVTL